MKYSDKEIVAQLKARNSKAVSYLIHKYLPMVKFMVSDYKYSDGNVTIKGCENDAEDIFQEALYIIIKKIDKGEFVLFSRLSTFLYSVCKNLLKLKLKRRLRTERFKFTYSEEYIEETESDEAYEESKYQQIFDYYFQQLSPVCRDILELFWLDKSNVEIAEILGNTAKYINKRKSECKKRLIDLIQENSDNIQSKKNEK